MRKMNKTNLAIIVLLTIIMLSMVLFASPINDVLKSDVSGIQLLNDYGFKHKLPEEWEGYSVHVSQHNKTSPNHEFMKALDPNYMQMIITHPDRDMSNQNLTFVLFDIESWNKNANDVTNDDNSKLPPIVYHSTDYVFSVDPYDYDMNRGKYDEVMDILYGLNYIERYQGDFKINDGVTIESDSIIYQENTSAIDITWRTILKDELQTTGKYSLDKEVNGTWIPMVSGHQSSLIIIVEENKLVYPVESLENGHYRLSIEYERLSLNGLELAKSPLYRAFAKFDVGPKAVKRNDDALKGIGLETEFEVYAEDTLEIRCKWFNTLDDEFMYGEYFTLEKYDNNTWQTVDFGDIGFHLVGYTLGPQSEAWHTYNMSWILDSLGKGKYRIKTDILQETLDGVNFGPGNHPSYVIYSAFEVRDEAIKRKMTEIYPDAFFYRNDEYGFSIELSDDWEGLKLVEENQNPNNPKHQLYATLDSNYKIIRLSYPKQFQEDQDIILILFKREAWNDNAHKATNSDLDNLPEMYFSSNDFIFSSDAYLYSSQTEHYKIIELIKTMKRY